MAAVVAWERGRRVVDLTRAELESHWQVMVRVAYSVLGCRDEAQDCAAAAIVQVLERQPQDIVCLEAFMVTVAKRRALDRLRVMHRDRVRTQLLAATTWDTGADPAEAVTHRAAAAWLAGEARSRLTPQSFRILDAVSKGRGLSEIAESEQLSVRAVESDLFRTRRLLRGVWVRSLAAVAAVWAGLRRAVVPAVPFVASAAAALVVVPMLTSRPPPADLSSAGGPSAVPLPHAASRHVVPAPVSTARRVATGRVVTPAVSASPSPRASTRVVTPVGTTTVHDEQHGSGADTGLVGGVVECIADVAVSPDLHDLGC